MSNRTIILRKLVARHAPAAVNETLTCLDELDERKRQLRAHEHELLERLTAAADGREVQPDTCRACGNPLWARRFDATVEPLPAIPALKGEAA